MVLYLKCRCHKTAKIGIVAFLTFMVNVGYADDLYVGFHGVASSNNYIYVEKLLSNGAISPVNYNGRTAISNWAPSMVKFNGNYFMAYRNAYSMRIFYSWSQDARHWNANLAIHNLQTDSAPELQVFNGRLYMFYSRRRTNDNDNKLDHRLFYTSTADGMNWTHAQRIPAGRTKTPPSAAVLNGKLYLIYRGRSSNHVYYNSTTNGTTWSGERRLPIKSSEAPDAAVHNNQLFVAFKGSSTRNVYLIRTSNGVNWSASWRPNPSWQTEKGPAIASFNNRLYLTHRDLSKNVRYSSSANGINSWGALLAKSRSRSGGRLNLGVY